MSNQTNASNEISPETSKRILTHMNDDHAISIYAMAKSTLTSSAERNMKLTNARMKSISLSGFDISFVLCKGDVCEMKKATIPFEPPLKTGKEAKARIVEEHYKAFNPSVSWLITDPIALGVLIICLLLAYVVYMMQDYEIVEVLEDYAPSFVVNLVDKSFCCHFTFASTFQNLCRYAWYFAIVAHALEALIVAYQCTVRFKLPKLMTLKWFVLGCSVGYPITGRVFDLVGADNKLKKEKDTKKTA